MAALTEELVRLDAITTDLNQKIGRYQMYKQIMELVVPIVHRLPPAFVAALERIDPSASP